MGEILSFAWLNVEIQYSIAIFAIFVWGVTWNYAYSPFK